MSVVPQFWSYVAKVFKTVLMEREKAFLYGCETGVLLGEVRVKVVHILDGIYSRSERWCDLSSVQFLPVQACKEGVCSNGLFSSIIVYAAQPTGWVSGEQLSGEQNSSLTF